MWTTLISARHIGNEYLLKLYGLPQSGDVFALKFDPGASHTVISIDLILAKLDVNQREEVFTRWANNYPLHVFGSATPTTMEGILCHAKNIRIRSTIFPHFYCYLVRNSRSNPALLGDDFISACTFQHACNSDIMISEFNQSFYLESMSTTDSDVLEAFLIDQLFEKFPVGL